MLKPTRFAVIVAALAVLTTACGEWTPPLPTAPSDPAAGATISGTVRNVSGVASSISPAPRLFARLLAALDAVTFAKPLAANSNVTVTVVGTSISATLNGSGQFVLNGVPSGYIQLQFIGPGVDARITINGVVSEHIQIVVTLNGSNASIDSMNRVQAGDSAEVEGVISSISRGDRSMKVNGFEIKVRDVPIWAGSSRVGIEMLAVGQRVRVQGSWVHDYVVASGVWLNPADGPGPTSLPPSGSYTLQGNIERISYGDRSMRVNGIEVKIWDAPVYQGSQRVGLSMLAVGQRVGITGN